MRPIIPMLPDKPDEPICLMLPDEDIEPWRVDESEPFSAVCSLCSVTNEPANPSPEDWPPPPPPPMQEIWAQLFKASLA